MSNEMGLLARLIFAIVVAFRKSPVEPETLKPTSTREVTGNEVAGILRSRFPEIGALFLSDAKRYFLCAYDDIAMFLAQDNTNKMDYIPEVRDCDDFSYRLMGQFSIPDWSALAFGIIWTDKHALNIIITEDKEVCFVEPQNDEIQTDLKLWQGTDARVIMM